MLSIYQQCVLWQHELEGNKININSHSCIRKEIIFRVFLETLDAQALTAMTMVFYVMVKLEILKSGI